MKALADNAARNVKEKTPTGWVKQPPNKFGGKWNEDADALKIGSQLVVIYSKWDTFILKFVRRFDGEERQERAKKKLEKLDLYRIKALKIFVDLTKITQAMRKNSDEEFKVKELLKKCSEQDHYRLLQMKENIKTYGKKKRAIPAENSNKAELQVPPKQRDLGQERVIYVESQGILLTIA
ncbi:hypothetical protein BB561_006576 [Smittium simulii]|uniref:Uncharacterized protein n=1 Tax=Smittium simulii TaxID=133385 RepID=A0A2T9Y311_9FUNG|nr:hypothetical protein BB561_006576 [Smittium simulii]